MLLHARAIVLVVAGTINAFCLTVVLRRWIIQRRVEHALALGMHGSRFIMAMVWIALIQGLVETGTPAGDIGLMVLATAFLVLTVFALIMVIRGS